MAGILGFGSSNKPGKGVKKEEREKKRFFQFFDILGRKFVQLIKLNLIYILFCLPIVTIGPATAAMMYIEREFVRGKPVFMFSDFKDKFKENFKQGFFMSLIQLIIFALCAFGFIVYYMKTIDSWAYWIPVVLISIVSVIFIVMNFYTYLMMITMKLRISEIFKNAFSFVFIAAKTNFLTFIFAVSILALSAYFFPITLIVIPIITFSVPGLIIAFNSYPYVDRYLVKPYYEANGLKNPDDIEEDDIIFKDAT